MLYIMESLSPGEHIIQPTGYHWMYVFQKVLVLILFVIVAVVIIGLGTIYTKYPTLPPWMIPQAWAQIPLSTIMGGFWSAHIIARMFAFLLILMGLIQVAVAMIIRATTEIAVTNRRLIFKRGIIARSVNELKIENIEGINVNQTVMGRLLNYGQMSAHGTGVGEIHFPDYMADPVSFRRAIQSARTVITPADQAIIHDMAGGTAGLDDTSDLAQAASRRNPGGYGSSVDI